MKSWNFLSLFLMCVGTAAQTPSLLNTDAERLRISAERARLEAAQAIDEAVCYRRFWVNDCLQEVKERSRDALADLRRQEIVLNDDARKARAAEQLQKTEDKSAPEKLQQDADRRAQAAKEFEDRMARDRQKTADRKVLQAGEKAKAEIAAGRLQSNKDKATGRDAKEASEAAQRSKFNQRLEEAKTRQDRYAREKASQSKPSAQPLPVPQQAAP